MLKLDHVCTEYDRVPMLRDVSLSIEKESLVCLLGSNGAGKSTTVKAVIGLVRPTRGMVYFEDRPIGRTGTSRIIEQGIAVVPEGRRLFPKMSVLENLKLGAYFVKDKIDRAALLERVFDLFPLLKNRVGQTAGTLSGGEQSMLSIGRGIMGRPRLLLLDEPSLGLAPKLVQEFFAAISRIHKEDKISMLLIEQNAAKALSVADRCYILQKGRIIAEGTAQELMGSDIVRRAYFCQTEG